MKNNNSILPLRILEYYRDQLRQDIESDIYVGRYYNTQLIIERQIEQLIKLPVRLETAYTKEVKRVGLLRFKKTKYVFDEIHRYDLPSNSIRLPQIVF